MTMKYLLSIAFVAFTQLHAQSLLKFDKRFVQSEDKWVAFQPNKDNSLVYGFIYIDAQAGLTLNYEGEFKITPTGEFIPEKLDSVGLKIRLQNNNVLVAFIPESKFAELKIPAVPDWLQIYKGDTNSVARLYQWGFRYNGWDECAKALTYLERAEKIDPHYEGLAVELAYSYNCLKQFDKAEAILADEIKSNPTAYVNKEYIFTLANSDQVEKAIQQFEQSQKTLTDKQYDAENCYNILQCFYHRKDKTNFNKWYDILMKQPGLDKQMTQWANNMKAAVNK